MEAEVLKRIIVDGFPWFVLVVIVLFYRRDLGVAARHVAEQQSILDTVGRRARAARVEASQAAIRRICAYCKRWNGGVACEGCGAPIDWTPGCGRPVFTQNRLIDESGGEINPFPPFEQTDQPLPARPLDTVVK